MHELPLWKTKLIGTSIHIPNSLLKYFDTFEELQISAFVGGGIWHYVLCNPDAFDYDFQNTVLSYEWENDNYKIIRPVDKITKNQLERECGDPVDLSFVNFPGNSTINDFLIQHGAYKLGSTEIPIPQADEKVGGRNHTSKIKNRKTTRKKIKKTKKTKKRKTKKQKRR